MFWWFEREGRFLRYEVSESAGTDGGYELRIIEPDGTEHTERFEDSAALSKRQIEFERELRAKGWTGPHGWNL